MKTVLLVIFFTLLSNPIFSDEFTYQCDAEGRKEFSLVFDIDLTKKSIVHSHSIFKNSDEVKKVDRILDIFLWDEENESVWTIQYKDPPLSVPSLTTILFNFKHQTLIVQSILNDTSIERSLSEDTIIQGDLYKCFSLR